jgi:rubrerythrin
MASKRRQRKVDPNQAGKEEEGAQPSGTEQGQAEDEEPGAGTEADARLVALMALAEMDLAAAAAYEIGAACFEEDDAEVGRQLLAFRDDHLRHVEDLDRLAQEGGGEPADREEAEHSVLAHLAQAADALGPRAALFAMISNEQLTTSTYGSILELAWEDDVQVVLERNFQDEIRHLHWLEQNRSRFDEEETAEERSTDGPGEQPGART